MSEARHADAETIAHIIDLRRRLALAEEQRDNALDGVWAIRRKYLEALAEIREIKADTLVKPRLDKDTDLGENK